MHLFVVVVLVVFSLPEGEAAVKCCRGVRRKRQYESEIVAISPNGRWTSVFHQPLQAIKEKGLPLLEHQGALRDIPTFPNTGPSNVPLHSFPFPPQGVDLNTLQHHSANPLPYYHNQVAPSLLLIVPAGMPLPSSVDSPASSSTAVSSSLATPLLARS